MLSGLRSRGRVNGSNGEEQNQAQRQGFVNGLSSRGRVNGLSNGGRGLYNGLVNGLDRKNGWVNGNGFINGFRMTNNKRILPLARRNFSLRVAFILIISAIIIVAPFYLISLMPEYTIKIDGHFFDWERAGYFSDEFVSASPEIDIAQYSIVVRQSTIYCYLSTMGQMFTTGSERANAFYVFFDTDGNGRTGYFVEGIGADLMVEIIGWNGTVQIERACGFATGADPHDFNGFVNRFPVNVMGSEKQVEFSVTVPGVESPVARFLSKNWFGEEDMSRFAIKHASPALSVSVDLVMPGILSPGTRETVMELSLVSQGSGLQVAGLCFEELGNASGFNLYLFEGSELLAVSDGPNISLGEPLQIQQGYGRSLSLQAELPLEAAGDSFGLELKGCELEVGDCPVAIHEVQTMEKVAYIGELPYGIVIDGAFGDWKNGFVMIDGDNDVQYENGSAGVNESIDILEYGIHLDDERVSMYLSVDDKMCNGTLIPKNIRLPVPGSGLPHFDSPELLGADVAGALIDIDMNKSTGVGYADVLGGDYLVLIAGKKGVVLQSELFGWMGGQNGSWESHGSVDAAVDHRRMEIGFNLSSIVLANDTVAAVGFFMTDWNGGTDYSDSILPLARLKGEWYQKAFGGVIINEVYSDRRSTDWIELYNTGSSLVSIDGWILYEDRIVLTIFEGTVLEPGEFIVIYGLDLSHKSNIILVDDQGTVVDSVRVMENTNSRSYSRTGEPPYAKWKQLLPTPGEINIGQTEIPEFSQVILPILLVILTATVLRMRYRRVVNGHG